MIHNLKLSFWKSMYLKVEKNKMIKNMITIKNIKKQNRVCFTSAVQQKINFCKYYINK